MNHMASSLKEAIVIFRKDKWTLLLSMAPIIIGILIYIFLGKWIYGDVFNWGKSLIESKVEGGWLNALSGIIVLALSIIFYFLINWTFVLVVSFFAAPFNDMISRRVEKIVNGQTPPELSESFNIMLKRLGITLLNEAKKIAFLLFLSLAGFALSFFLPPVSFVVSSLLYALNFVDYSWGRHDLHFRSCLKDTKDSFIPYSITGAGFLVLVAIPVLNLFILPYSTVYYTVLFTKRQKVLEQTSLHQ